MPAASRPPLLACVAIAALLAVAALLFLDARPPFFMHRFGTMVETPMNPLGM